MNVSNKQIWAGRSRPLTLNLNGMLHLCYRVAVLFLPIIVFAFLLVIGGLLGDQGQHIYFTPGRVEMREGKLAAGLVVLGLLIMWLVVTCALIPAVIHELGHALALRYVADVRHIRIESTPLRFSLLTPHEDLTPKSSLMVAVAGPAAAFIGGTVWQLMGHSFIAFWWYMHLIMLLPLFGDGKELVKAITAIRAPGA